MPDEKTIWVFKEELTKKGLFEKLFDEFYAFLELNNLIMHEGTMIDGSFVEKPRQRNTREENKQFKEGKCGELWKTVTADQVELRLNEWWKKEKLFFSKREAIVSLSDEIILHYGKSNTSISPYDSYGYHIVSISAHSGGAVCDGEGVFVHIRR